MGGHSWFNAWSKHKRELKGHAAAEDKVLAVMLQGPGSPARQLLLEESGVSPGVAALVDLVDG
jgi:hypothetical protein